MCHVMSIDEQVTCVGWFNVLMTEFIDVSGRKDVVYLYLSLSYLYLSSYSYFRSTIWIR